MMNYKKINNLTGWFVFLIATAVYLMTMEETTSLWDCGEYITTANKLEVGHPPGAPFWMMMGRLFSAFASPENAAMMVNAMSALSSSFTILFMFWTITMLVKKMVVSGSEELNKANIFAIMGAGFVGSLVYTFSDSFWFSAVEGEVYAMSSLFTAIVFWAILKWEVEVDKFDAAVAEGTGFRGNPDRWIVFIAYMVGLSIGVHLLNLLAIPAIGFVIYFKKYKKVEPLAFVITGVVSIVTLGFVQSVLIPKSVSIADWFERLFVNSLGMPFNTGFYIFVIIVVLGLGYGLYATAKAGKTLLNTIILSLAVLLIGYSSFVMIPVRSAANTPLDENNPESLASLVSYLNRDQYGAWPLLKGQYWHSPTYGSCDADKLKAPKSNFMKAYAIKSISLNKQMSKQDAIKLKGELYLLGVNMNFSSVKGKAHLVNFSLPEREYSFMNLWEKDAFLAEVAEVNAAIAKAGLKVQIQFNDEVETKYIDTYEGKAGDKKYDPEYTTIFPRMYRQGYGSKYIAWSDYEGNQDKPMPYDGRYNKEQVRDMLRSQNRFQDALKLESEGIYMPTMGENINYMFKYQLGWMYWRYFMWNFSGRQTDIQGNGITGNSQFLEGNWISGVSFIDEPRIGSQDNLPVYLKDNKGRNVYYMLPLILCLIGFVYHLIKAPKDWFTVLLLFLLTGIAIVMYLNQKPNEPRERDYAFAASFYAFAIWAGVGVYALFKAAVVAKFKEVNPVVYVGVAGTVLMLAIITDFNSAIYVAVVGGALFGLMMLIGKASANRTMHAGLVTILTLVIPVLMAAENWDDHDRSNRTTARDLAYNYLASCDKNENGGAILFTNGDNDTFPLWYIQEVEGVRTDVRVANMSLLSTDWHINQMKRQAYESKPLPIKMKEFSYRSGTRDYVVVDAEKASDKWVSAKEAMAYILDDSHKKHYDFSCQDESYTVYKNIYITVDKDAAIANGILREEDRAKAVDTIRWRINSQMLYKADLAVLDMLANYKWDRPIYFASLAGMQANSGLKPYMQSEGLTYKLTPIRHGANGGTNSDKMYELMMDSENGFKWGNMKGKGVYVDYYTMRMVYGIRVQMMFLVNDLIAQGEKEKAVAILDKVFEEMPIDNNQVPADDICVRLCASYYQAGAKEKGDALAKKLVELELGEVAYYLSLDRDIFFPDVRHEYGKAMNNLEVLREASLEGLGQSEMFKPDESLVGFAEMGILEGTNYKEVFIEAKQLFNATSGKYQNLYSDPQRFPVNLIRAVWLDGLRNQ
ncbi:MAG: DUF2723 domain-containing protein [Flavobacteriales bacterium]|nr:DUF2723 domain-containing protein [Flavobacteriales bacterium]